MNSAAISDTNPANKDSIGLRVVVALFCLLAVLQGVVFLIEGSGASRAASLACAILSVFLAFSRLPLWIRSAGVAFLALVAFGNFLGHLVAAQEPYPLRKLQAGVAYGYAAIWGSCLISLIFRRIILGAVVSAATLAIGLTVFEGVAEHLKHAERLSANPSVVRWEGGTAPHPVLEEFYPPNSVAKTHYISNPRGYFTPADPRPQRWRLNINDPASSARTSFPGDQSSDRIRVDIDRAGGRQPWHIQLNFVGVRVVRDEGLLLAFRARAEHPRSISFAVSQDHQPWQGLGLYREIDLDATWKDVVVPFTPTSSDDAARIHFDLGGGTEAVEIEAVQLRRRDSSESVVRELPTEYSVVYRFNDRGCRGPDLPAAGSSNRRRILVLGDSFGLGVGVHEPDTFSAQLEKLLNADGGKTKYDVVNCSVSGYATRQEREMFEIQAPFYRPSVVIVPMVENDDASWRSDVAKGYFHVPTKYERLFLAWGYIQALRHLKPRPDFSQNVAELRQLRDSCERIGARLVVVAFRNTHRDAGNWEPLIKNVSAGLAGTDVLWADLGDVMLREHEWKDLAVHQGGDYHPNEVAHRSAAIQLAQLLRTNGLVK